MPYEGINCRIDECPVSYITPESRELVQIYLRSTQMKKSQGASLYGPDLNRWPARTVDAFTCLESERIRTENAQSRAETQDR
jgi:hypothetical protein